MASPRPLVERGTSAQPVNLFCSFQVDSPWRRRTSWYLAALSYNNAGNLAGNLEKVRHSEKVRQKDKKKEREVRVRFGFGGQTSWRNGRVRNGRVRNGMRREEKLPIMKE